MMQKARSEAAAENAPIERRSIFGEFMVLFSSWVGLALLVALQWSPSPLRLVYNASDSAPRGFYVVEPTSQPRAGDLIVVRLRHDVAALAAQRKYLPIGAPLIKPVAAVAPQHVCVDAGSVRIDGAFVGSTMAADAGNRPLTAWHGCRQLAGREVFLLGTHSASFDSRYFGPVDARDVIGRARPLGNRSGI